jgi:hypothetical protein
MQSSAQSPIPVVTAAVEKKAQWFFPVMAVLMLAIVGIAFAPTFYLRGLGTEDLPPGLQSLPGYAYAHGVALTVWFLLFFAQTVLVASGRTSLHRRLGVAGVIAATAVVITSFVVLQRAIGGTMRAPLLDVPVVVFFNLLSLIQFSVLVACALRFRREPEIHKRLMFLANVPILTAAANRLPGIAELPLLVGVSFSLVLLVALIARDFAVDRRLHRATLWGGIVFVIVPRPIVAALGLSGLGRTFVEWLA